MFTGKILTTLVAITTAVILLSQLTASSEIMPDIYEPYVMYPIQPVLTTHCERDPKNCHKHHKHHKRHKHHGGKKLIGDFPDTMFVASKHLQTPSVMGGAFQANSISGQTGLMVNALANGGDAKATFASYAAASGVLDADVRENYSGPTYDAKCAKTSCKAAGNCSCGTDGYGQQNVPKSDYNAFDTDANDLPIDGMLAYSLPAGSSTEMNAQGEMMPVICRSQMMYSTSKRYGSNNGCMLRGDIPIMGCQPRSATAATAADTLSSGAFLAMGGLNNDTAKLVATQIAEGTGGAITSGGGGNLAEAVMQEQPAPSLTSATYLSSTVQTMLEGASGTPSRAVNTSTGNGEVGVYVDGWSGF